MIKLVINTETPAKKNNRIIDRRTGRSFPSKRYTDWHQKAVQAVSYQWRKYGKTALTNCKIVMLFVHGDKRRRDSDNGVNSIFDTLVDCGVLEDDNWQVVSSHYVLNSYEKNNPRCEIRIFEENEIIDFNDIISSDFLFI